MLYAHMTTGLQPEAHREFDRLLVLPFDHEMTEFELKREEARRLAQQRGILGGDATARAVLGLPKIR